MRVLHSQSVASLTGVCVSRPAPSFYLFRRVTCQGPWCELRRV